MYMLTSTNHKGQVHTSEFADQGKANDTFDSLKSVLTLLKTKLKSSLQATLTLTREDQTLKKEEF